MPLIPLLVGGGLIIGASGTAGYVMGIKTSQIAAGIGLGAAAYLAWKYGSK